MLADPIMYFGSTAAHSDIGNIFYASSTQSTRFRKRPVNRVALCPVADSTAGAALSHTSRRLIARLQFGREAAAANRVVASSGQGTSFKLIITVAKIQYCTV